MLLEQPRINVNVFGKKWGTPLHCAILGGHDNVVITLMKCPAINVHLWSSEHMAPICLALQKNEMKCVRALRAHPSLKLARNFRLKHTMPRLPIAAGMGNKAIVELRIVDPKMRLDKKSCGKRATRDFAPRNGSTECTKLDEKKRKPGLLAKLFGRIRSAK